MKKIIAPRVYRISRAEEIIWRGDFFHQATFPSERKIKKQAKPKKTRPKKSLAQIAYETRFKGCRWDLCSIKDVWQECAEAVAREVRKRIKQQKENK